jgi:ABC-type branched-subunit amino acid transport system permease subunit
MVLLIPGLLALVFGWLAFRSRVTGVYFSIMTQAMTFALMLAFFRNEMGFGGNNGLTDFKDLLGFDLQADTTRSALFAITGVAATRVLHALPNRPCDPLWRCGYGTAGRGKPRAFSRLPGRRIQACRVSCCRP